MSDNGYVICAKVDIGESTDKVVFYRPKRDHEIVEGYAANFTLNLDKAARFKDKEKAKRTMSKLDIGHADPFVITKKEASRHKRDWHDKYEEHHPVLTDKQFEEREAGYLVAEAENAEVEALDAIKRWIVCIKDESGHYMYLMPDRVLTSSGDIYRIQFTSRPKEAVCWHDKEEAKKEMAKLNISSKEPFIVSLKKAIRKHRSTIEIAPDKEPDDNEAGSIESNNTKRKAA